MQNELDYKNIQKIGLVSRIGTNLDKEILYLNEILKEKKVQLLLLKNSSSLNLPSFEIDELFKQSDFVISLGGDGTLISLSKKAFEFNKAILGINAGKLGFLTDFKVEKAREFFDEFFMGKFRIEKPFMLDISLENEKEKILKYAFNDVFFFREQNVSMAHFELYRNNKIFNEYNGDGLIVATPAGSTAYNLSANGPIVYTLAQVFILTPICSHSLTQRPIVLPKGFDLEVRAKNCLINIDGHENFKADDFSKIKVGLSEKSVSLIHPKSRDYFQILKEKLHWGH